MYFVWLSVQIYSVFTWVYVSGICVFLGILPNHGDGRLNTFSVFETWSSPLIPHTFTTLWLLLRCVQHVCMYMNQHWTIWVNWLYKSIKNYENTTKSCKYFVRYTMSSTISSALITGGRSKGPLAWRQFSLPVYCQCAETEWKIFSSGQLIFKK